MSFRIEEKITVTRSQASSSLQAIFGKGAKLLYPDRLISSCYFDTRNFDLFVESEEGVLPRRKIRLRYYPEAEKTQFMLETKISSVEGRYKTTKAIDGVELQRAQSVGLMHNRYGMLKPALWVTYRRSYFVLNGLRLTLDRDITYRKTGVTAGTVHERMNVIELKAPFNAPRDMLAELFEQPRRRFSKYSNAVKLLGLSRS